MRADRASVSYNVPFDEKIHMDKSINISKRPPTSAGDTVGQRKLSRNLVFL